MYVHHTPLLFHGFLIHSQLNLWMQKVQMCGEVQMCIHTKSSGHAAENPGILPFPLYSHYPKLYPAWSVISLLLGYSCTSRVSL